jgi:ABC-type Na+ efflux pump permease subunit
MRKILVIAVREYRAAVQTKAFLVMILAMPMFMIGSIAIQKLMRDKVDTNDKTVAVWDQTGRLYAALEVAGAQRDAEEVFIEVGGERKKVKPHYLLQEAHPTADTIEQATLELSERVRNDEIFAFLIIGRDVIDPPEETNGGKESMTARVAYHSANPNYDDIEDWAGDVLNAAVQEIRFQALNLQPEVVRKSTRQVSVANLSLISRDESGRITAARETNRFANFMIPFGLMMLMFMVVMVAASPLVQVVLEEKMQRIAEVLLGSTTPFQLMMGKLVGVVGVSLTIATLYLGGALFAVYNAGYGALLPTGLLWWFVVYQGLAVVFFGALFVAIGAAVSDLKEAQSMMMPVSLLIISPMFVWMSVIKEPLSTSSTLMSFFPPATPMLMMLRISVAPGLPMWQPLLGIVIVLLAAIAAVFVAGRIFRVGILMQGKGANFSEMFRWAVRG